MVLRYSKNGLYSWHEGPYTEDEIREVERRMCRAPVAFTRPGACCSSCRHRTSKAAAADSTTRSSKPSRP